jgi:GNAT superfamily N-acetyltransferase
MTLDQINDTIIRRAVPFDAEGIASLFTQLVSDPSMSVLPERIVQISQDANTALLVAECHGRLCATALVSLCSDIMFRFQPFAVVENIVVDESVRRTGIGTALLRHIERFCIDADCSKIMLLSAADRQTAHQFFERAGFSGSSKRGFVKYRRHMLNATGER